MDIKIRLMGHDLPIARYTTLQLNAGSTIEDAIVEYLKDNDIGQDLKSLSKSQFIVNKDHCSISKELNDGDELTIVRYLGGG